MKNSDSIKLKLRTPLLTSLLKSKPGKTGSNLNSLQKLSQSCEDSNSPVNSASFLPVTSPTSTELKQLGTIETNKGKPEKIPDTERLDKMTDKNSKINDEKRLINVIRKVFKEEFAQQEKNILNLISVNFSITQQQIKNVKKEILDLRKSIEFTENQLEEKVNNTENKLADIEHRTEKIYDYQIDVEQEMSIDQGETS